MRSVALHVAELGPPDAPAVLLGSSLGATHRMWQPQLGALAERHRVLAFDHRGHGASPEPPGPYTVEELGADVVRVLDDRGIERAHYAGLSMGGMIGQWLGVHAADRIDRLALLCTTPHLGPPSVWHDRARVVREAGSTAPLADAILGRWLTPAYAEAHPEDAALLREHLLASPAEGYAACCDALAAFDVREELGRITAPTLVVGAAQDESTPPEHAERIAAGIPGARLEILDPGAHVVSLERAADVNALLLDHFA